MNRKIVLIAGGVLILGAFLLGFVPQYLKARDLGSQLGALRQQLSSEREKSQMEELALLCGYAYLETNLRNYGLASQYSTRFFDGVRAMTIQAPDPDRQPFLQAALTRRDLVMGGLGKGDSGTVSALQDLFQRALETVQTGSK